MRLLLQLDIKSVRAFKTSLFIVVNNCTAAIKLLSPFSFINKYLCIFIIQRMPNRLPLTDFKQPATIWSTFTWFFDLYTVICFSGTFRKTNLKKWQKRKKRHHFACSQQQILNECWWGVSSFWWEPHLGRMAHRAIREQPFSFFLLSGHDYEKRTLWDNGPCIPCLVPIHKVGTLPSLQHHSSSVIRGRGGAVLQDSSLKWWGKKCLFVRKNFGGAKRFPFSFLPN